MHVCLDGTALVDVGLEDQIRIASAAGFRCLHVRASLVEDYLATYPTAAVLDALLRQHGVYIAVLDELILPTIDTYETWPMTQARLIELCTHLDALGGGLIIVRPGIHPDLPEPTAVARTGHDLRVLAGLAAPFEVQLALEVPVDEGNAARSLSHGRQIVERVSQSNVGLALSLSQQLPSGVTRDLDALDVDKLWFVRLGVLPATWPFAGQPLTDGRALALRPVCVRLANTNFGGPYSVQPCPDAPSLDVAARAALDMANALLLPTSP